MKDTQADEETPLVILAVTDRYPIGDVEVGDSPVEGGF